MTRLRLGIPVTYQFSVRYVLHTGLLQRLAQVVDPVVLLAWEDPELEARLEAVGAEVRRLPEGEHGPAYLRHRRQVDLAWQARLRSPTTAIDWRRRDAIYTPNTRARRRLRRLVERAPLALPGGIERTFAREAQLVETDTDLAAVAAAAEGLGLDAVCAVTPYHRREELLLRALARTGMPMVASIISFDNPTSRPWIPVTFDRYLVWNEHNRAEVVRSYPDVEADRVTVTGAPQFDFYANPRWCWDAADWRQRLGLPAGRPVVLFAGGPPEIVPEEPQYLDHLLTATAEGRFGPDPIVLFRRHPMEPAGRWDAVMDRHPDVVVADDPWPVGPSGRVETSSAGVADIERLVSTLAHSAVHISTSSTMTVDGAWFDRPQVGPAYDETGTPGAAALTRDLYQREHWLPINASGGMVVAGSRAEMVAAVGQGLDDPAAGRSARVRLVETIVTSRDGRATERVVAGVADALGLERPPAGPPGAPHPEER